MTNYEPNLVKEDVKKIYFNSYKNLYIFINYL